MQSSSEGEHAIRVGFLGCGSLGSALLRGFLSAGVLLAENVVALRRDETALRALQRELSIKTATSVDALVQESDVILLCVKPQVAPALIDQMWETMASLPSASKLLISVCAGVSLLSLLRAPSLGTADRAPPALRPIRVMPSINCAVGASATAYCMNQQQELFYRPTDEQFVRRLFLSVGTVHQIAESMMDASTALCGSGPAFVYIFLEALTDGAVRAGLPRAIAQSMAIQTLYGSSLQLHRSGLHPASLKDAVASPGGTTMAGIHELEKAAFRGSVISAVHAAAERGKELGIGTAAAAAGTGVSRNLTP